MSRRKAEEEMKKGTITVNNMPCELGQKVDESDVVMYNGKIIEKQTDEKYYFILNKPRGYVTTMSDERGRKCIADLTRDLPCRVYPVGRLDLNSEGLVILTNDGEVANRLMHPKGEVEKVYNDPLLGCTVVIDHGSDVKTFYSNLANNESLAKVGDTLSAGECIGNIGDTSISELAEEPHLHFEVSVGDSFVDPLEYISDESKSASLQISAAD
jgi:hypothetical protein